jgi:hypothetical protein
VEAGVDDCASASRRTGLSIYAFGRIYDRRRKLREGRLEESALQGSLSRPGCCNGSWRRARMSGAPAATGLLDGVKTRKCQNCPVRGKGLREAPTEVLKRTLDALSRFRFDREAKNFRNISAPDDSSATPDSWQSDLIVISC